MRITQVLLISSLLAAIHITIINAEDVDSLKQISDVTGLTGYYFNNTALAWPPVLSRVDQDIDFVWNATEEPAPGVSSEYFSVLWLGMLNVPANDTYTFSTYGNDGVRVWLDNKLLIDNWQVRSPGTDVSVVNASLSAQAYSLQIEFYKGLASHSTSLSLSWKITNTSSPFQVISSKYLSPVVSNSTMQEVMFFDSVARGWNTWDNKNTLGHVLLPEAFSFSVGYANVTSKQYVSNAHVQCNNDLMSGLHAPLGNYTEISSWSPFNGSTLHIESAHTPGGGIVVLITPLASISTDVVAVVTASMLWNRVGNINIAGSIKIPSDAFITASFPGFPGLSFYSTEIPVSLTLPFIGAPYQAYSLSGPLGFSSGTYYNLSQIQQFVAAARAPVQAQIEEYGQLSELYKAMHTVVSWNTIFDPHEGVITPVSRGWDFGAGYVLFDWDNYFCSWMSTLIDKSISYGNLLRITQAAEMHGFIPNYVSGIIMSRDRSEPPVGAMAALAVYNKFREKWILEAVYPNLLTWNRWWWARRNEKGLMMWGSDDNLPDVSDCCNLQAARYESGLDNSPMYDSPPVMYNITTHHMQLWDVGLNALLVRDCQDLAQIATVLGYTEDAEELTNRGKQLAALLNSTLWNEEMGIYINKQSDTGAFYPRLAPPLFYPMIASVASDNQVLAMLQHLTNASEFCVSKECQYAVPSIARNDPAFKDNNYWRGRTWGPHNFLVYLGLANYNHLPEVNEARVTLCAQAANLLLGDWLAQGHVQENYNSVTGLGCDVSNADPFYHWGALNGFINILEFGNE